MKNILLVVALLLMSFVNGMSQTTWEKLFSGRSDSTDAFRCVREVPGGGYITAGYTNDTSINLYDGFAVRLNDSGDTIWTFRYNGPLSKNDLFYKVINTSDGGFLLCGYTSSVTGLSDDAVYLKLNSAGQQQWVKFWGGNGKERAQDILQLTDGGYVVVGYTTTSPAQYYDAFFLRTNSNGDIIHTRRYGAANYDDVNSVKLLPEGGFILGGQSNFDQFLVKTDTAGVLIWSKRFGTTESDNIECVSLLPDGYLLAGNTYTSTTGDDGYLVKTDTSGTVIWTKTFGGSLQDDFHTVDTTSDGGFVACGTTSSTGGLSPNIWLMRTNANGDSLWSRTFGGDNHDHGYSGKQTSDGGYIIVGHTGSYGENYEEAIVVKTDSSGNVSNPLTYTSVSAIISPSETTCGSATTQVRVWVHNYGRVAMNIPVTVQISGIVNQTLNQSFNFPGDSGGFVTFNTTINTAAGGMISLYCYTNNNNDVYPQLNSFTKTFNIDITKPAPVPTGNQKCGAGTLLLTATAANPIYWYNVPAGGTSFTTGTSYTTPNLSSTTTYYVQTGTTCPSARLPVTATINPVSVDPIVAHDSICGSGSLTLGAIAADAVSWYTSSSGGSPIATGNTFNTPVLSTSTNYYAQASNGTCPSNRVVVHAIVNTAAADPVPTANFNCGPGTVTLTASSADQAFWYDVPTGGVPVGSGPSFTTPSITNSTTYYVQADNGCLSNRVSVIATINPPVTPPLTTNDFSCGPASLTLSANSTLTIIWYDAITGGNQVGFGATFNTPLLTTTKTYYAQAIDGLCSSIRVAAVGSIYANPLINLGHDTVIIATSYMIDAGAGFSAYLWTTSATTQTINVSTPDTYCVTVTDGNTCTATDCVFIDITDDIKDVAKINFSIYPNPTHGKITIDIPLNSSVALIDLMDITGKVVSRYTASQSGKTTLDLSSYTKGIYLLKIGTEKSSSVKRIVIN